MRRLPLRTRARSRSGFTLLEVMIALAILGMSLMAIFQLNSGAIAMHAYAKRLTVATILARSKMTDLEQELFDEGFQTGDQELSGNFDDEGWQSYKWRAKIIAPETTNVSPEKFMGALFNLPIGGDGDSDDPLGGLGGLLSGGGAAAGLPPGSTPGASPLAGMASGLMTQQFSQMLEQIAQQVREVHLTVSWKDGTQVESVDLVTHVVSPGRGGDRNAAGGVPSPSPGPPPMRRSSRGFTLMEILIAVSIVGLMGAVTAGAFQTSVRARDMVEHDNVLYRQVRIALSRMSRELGSAFVSDRYYPKRYRDQNDRPTNFIGEARAHHLHDLRPPADDHRLQGDRPGDRRVPGGVQSGSRPPREEAT